MNNNGAERTDDDVSSLANRRTREDAADVHLDAFHNTTATKTANNTSATVSVSTATAEKSVTRNPAR